MNCRTRLLPANRPLRLCRHVQFLGIKLLSCFPNHECRRGNLTCQSQPRHLCPHAVVFQLFQVRFVGLVPITTCGGGDKHFLQASVAIAIQAPGRHRFSPTHHFPLFHFVLRTHVRDHGQSDVAPELTLRTESVRAVDDPCNHRCSNGSQLRNRSQQTHGGVCSALGHHHLPGLLP